MSASASERLILDNLREVRHLLHKVRRRWYDIGIELGLSVEELDTIRADNTDLLDCLTAMLKTWLKLTDPIPTWRALGEALRAPTINEVELANQGSYHNSLSRLLELGQ